MGTGGGGGGGQIREDDEVEVGGRGGARFVGFGGLTCVWKDVVGGREETIVGVGVGVGAGVWEGCCVC